MLLVPINLELLDVKADALAGLPMIVEARGPPQVHAVVLWTLDEELGANRVIIDSVG
jgi:hypothetical protein